MNLFYTGPYHTVALYDPCCANLHFHYCHSSDPPQVVLFDELRRPYTVYMRNRAPTAMATAQIDRESGSESESESESACQRPSHLGASENDGGKPPNLGC